MNSLIVKVSFNRRINRTIIHDFVIFVVNKKEEAINMVLELVPNLRLNSLIVEEKTLDKLDIITHNYGNIIK